MSDERTRPGAPQGGSLRASRSAGVWFGTALVVLGLLVVAVVGVNALRDDDPRDGSDRSGRSASSDGPTSSDGAASSDEPDQAGAGGRTPVPGYGFGEVALVVVEPDGTRHVLCVMTAEDAEQRARGLMEVTDESLGGYDGMLFLFPVDSNGGFWMRNTPMPLSIAYLSADGETVSTADMEPCEDSPDCPSYPAEGPYRMALEVPQGRLADLGVVPGARLQQEDDCPAASG